MARHAGFSSVLSFTEALANEALGLIQVPVQTFDLPVTVGGVAVTIAGQWAPSAQVTFTQRSDGLVTTTLGIGGQAVISGAPLPTQYIEFALTATLDLPLNVSIQNGFVAAVIDSSQIAVLHLALSFSGGPPIISNPPAAAIQNALGSPAVAAEATGIIRQLAPLTITLPLISASLSETVSVGPPPPPLVAEGPIPNYFTLEAEISGIVLAQFDGAVTIAVDLASAAPGQLNQPITAGNAAQLVDMTTAFSPLIIYWQLSEPGQAQFSSGTTIAGPPSDDVNCVALVNPVVISYMLANGVSPGLSAAPLIDGRLRVTSVAADIGWFVPPVPYQPGYGLAVTADITAYSQALPNIFGYVYPDPAGVSAHVATITAYLQETLSEVVPADASSNAWNLLLVNDTISLPVWVEFVLFIALIMLAAISPVLLVISMILSFALGIGVAELTQALTNYLTSSGSPVAAGIYQGLSSVSVPFEQTVTLPGGISVGVTTYKLGFSEEGPEAQLALGAGAPSAAAGTAGGTSGGAAQPEWGAWLSLPAALAAGPYPSQNVGPLPPGTYNYQLRYDQTSITISADVSPPTANPLITWSVTRPDTGQLLVSQSSHYLDADQGSLTFSRTDNPAIQSADLISVAAQITGPGGTVNYTFNFQVIDWLNRNYPYVRWVSHTWFRDPAKPKQWRYYWQRTRPSVLHRTDYPGRCRRLNPGDDLDLFLQVYPDVAAGSLDMAVPLLPVPLAAFPQVANLLPEAWLYTDLFPFPSAAAAQAGRRGKLCDYCFFGGPTKTQLLVSVP